MLLVPPCATDMDSHLSQVMLVDKDLCSVVQWGLSGMRIDEVGSKHMTLGPGMLLAGAHFPHRAAPQKPFEEALWELENSFCKARHFKLVCIVGDWNTQSGDDRFNDLTALSSLFCLQFSPSASYTFGAYICIVLECAGNTTICSLVQQSAIFYSGECEH